MTDTQTAVFPVRIVLKRTGLTAELLRAWERRYGVVAPSRTKGGQRLYSESDVARLSLLRRATQHGHSIGRLSELPDADIVGLLTDLGATGPDPAPAQPATVAAHQAVARSLEAVHWMDGAALEVALRRAAILLGPVPFAEWVVAPLVREIGEQWHQGRLRIVQEHLATATIRQIMSGLLASLPSEPAAPIFIAGTTTGQHHELGAMLAAATAAAAGWRSVYVGSDLPGDEIGLAAERLNAKAIGLSIVFPIDEAVAEREFKALARSIRPDTAVLVGGEGARHLAGLIHRLGFRPIEALPELTAWLAA